MNTDTLPNPGTAQSTWSEQAAVRDPRRNVVRRMVAAAFASALVCLAVWSLIPRSLSGPIDIVGYPTFFNFDYRPALWAYRLSAIAFPVLTVLLYLLFGRRHKVPTRVYRLKMLKTDTSDFMSASRAGTVLRLALPAAVVVIAGGTRTGVLDRYAIGGGLVYLAAVLGGGWLWSRRRGVALANGLCGCAAAILSAWFVSRHTTIIAVDGSERTVSWLPAWLAALALAAVLGWTARQIVKGRDAHAIERALLIVVGAIALFITASYLSRMPFFYGDFDESVPMAGANLLNLGYVPWRDLLVIHGLWLDVLSGSVNMAVFGDSIWAISVGQQALLMPLCWVSLYLFAAWVSRGNPWMPAIVALAAISGLFPVQIRFILVPLTLVVLGETLRRRGRAWCAGLTLLLFVQAVLVPETGFLGVPALICVAAADLLHREPTATLWLAMRPTRWCATTGIIALLAFGAWLHSIGALRPFIDYYRVFAPGHNMSGATPPTYVTPFQWLSWVAGVLLVIFTIFAVARKLLRGEAWSPQDWVAVAVAGFLAVYEEKALGRFDWAHVDHVNSIAMALAVYWLWKGLSSIDITFVNRRTASSSMVTATGMVCAVLLLVWTDPVVTMLGRVLGQHRILASPNAAIPRLSYAEPNAVDAVMLGELDAAIRKYARDDQPVFDMTNSPGYLYYLLGREPGTRFMHISMAVTPYAQGLLIDELKKSRPPVVVFESSEIGLSTWDGIASNVRHYAVSRYVLDNWIPIQKTGSTLLLLRRDLATAPAANDLWFGGRECDWGASANFLPSTPQGARLNLPVTPIGERSYVEVRGWAANPDGSSAREVVLVAGDRVVGSAVPWIRRYDVGLHLKTRPAATGFRVSAVVRANEKISVYQLGDDGKLRMLDGSEANRATAITFPDGRRVEVGMRGVGVVERYDNSVRSLGRVDLPAGSSLSGYDLVSLPSTPGRIVITDDPARIGHQITAVALPGSGPVLRLRVGGCLQWHGYAGARSLYVLQEGGPLPAGLELSAHA